MLGLVLCALGLLAACGPRPARASSLSHDSSSDLYCVSGLSDDGESLLACAETEESCATMRKMALRYGEWSHISEVGRCDYLEVEAE